MESKNLLMAGRSRSKNALSIMKCIKVTIDGRKNMSIEEDLGWRTEV
jgi:hypothetical protein